MIKCFWQKNKEYLMKLGAKIFFIISIVLNALSYCYAEPNKETISSDSISINKFSIKENEHNKIASDSLKALPKNEVINTLYPDPLSDEFMDQGDEDYNAERNRSTADLLSEFNAKVKVINDNTEIPEEIKERMTREEREKIEAKADSWIEEIDKKASSKNRAGAVLDESVASETEFVATNSEVIGKEEISSDSVELPIVEGDKNIDSVASTTTDTVEQAISDNSASSTQGIVSTSTLDINKAEIKQDWPEQDPEFLAQEIEKNKTEVKFEDSGNAPLPDEIPDYSNLSGVITEETVSEDSQKSNKDAKKNKKGKKGKKSKKKFEKAEPLEPVLLTQGKPVSEDDESVKEVSYTGLLVPEKIRLARRKYMYRWVLKVDDETRIPLKSNLKLMQELKKEELIDDFVTIKGKLRSSGEDKNVKYLIPDSITKGEAKNSDKKANDKNKSEQIADEQNLASGTNEIVASETLSLEDVLASDSLAIGSENNSIASMTVNSEDIASASTTATTTEEILSESSVASSSVITETASDTVKSVTESDTNK